jgi:hypothetical protein
MSLLSKLAGAQGRRDEEPNKELGRMLVQKNDTGGIQEIARNLHHKDKRVQTDCLAVLEEVGRQSPELIQDYVEDFIELTFSKNNRLVWQAMINLALIADRKPVEIFDRFEDLVRVIDTGSVITQDNGIKTLAKVASANKEYNQAIMPFLLKQLQTCRPKSIPQYAESILFAVNQENQDHFLEILNQRSNMLSAAQQKRVNKIVKQFDQN